jgi:hypothetical protein
MSLKIRQEFERPIGELSQEEILEEFEKSIEENSKITINFIVTWLKIIDLNDDENLVKEKYPEYFL